MSTFFQDLLDSLQPRDVVQLSPGNFAPVTNRIDLNALTTPGPITNRIDLNDPMYDNTIGPPEELASDGVQPSAGKEALFSSVLSAIQQEEQGGRAAQLIPPVAEITPGGSGPTSFFPIEQQASMVEQPITLAKTKRVQPAAAPSAPAAAAPAPAKDDDFAALLALAQNKGPDRGGQKADLEAQRNALLNKAESERQLTDEEKVATALLAAVPGLLGAIAGGAISGGYGAAAGAAGGLQGGAQGIQGIIAGKEAKRKEAKTDADKLAERIAMLDEKIAAQVEKADDRELDMRLRERAAKKSEVLDREKMKLQKQIADDNNTTQIKTTSIREEGESRRLQATLKNTVALAKLKGQDPRKIDDADKSFYTNTGNGMRAVAKIRELVSAGGADIGAHLSNSGVAHLLDQEVANLAHALTKIGDPNSAVLLAELENTRKTLLANPTTTRTDIFLKKVRAAEEKIANTAVDYSQITGIPINQEVQRAFGGAAEAKPAPHGAVVRQNGHTFKWNGSEYIEVQ
jgi:hypothetical protein